jgi:hypothetical protein
LLQATNAVMQKQKGANLGKISFLTVSYYKDFERFLLLRESVNRFYKDAARHLVIVPREDIPLFQGGLKGDTRVDVLAQNDFAASYFYPRKWYGALKKIVPGSAWRFRKYAGVSGWQIQQPIKLNLPKLVSSGVVIILDSDVVFVRPFIDSDFEVTSGQSRVMVRMDQKILQSEMRLARKVLKLDDNTNDYHYTTMPMVMYVDWVQKLQEHLENIHGCDWQMVLFNTGPIHEDCLYGVFVKEILKPSNLVLRADPFSSIVWDEASLQALLNSDFHSLSKQTKQIPLCLVVQSNLNSPVSDYRQMIESFWNQNR